MPTKYHKSNSSILRLHIAQKADLQAFVVKDNPQATNALHKKMATQNFLDHLIVSGVVRSSGRRKSANGGSNEGLRSQAHLKKALKGYLRAVVATTRSVFEALKSIGALLTAEERMQKWVISSVMPLLIHTLEVWNDGIKHCAMTAYFSKVPGAKLTAYPPQCKKWRQEHDNEFGDEFGELFQTLEWMVGKKSKMKPLYDTFYSTSISQFQQQITQAVCVCNGALLLLGTKSPFAFQFGEESPPHEVKYNEWYAKMMESFKKLKASGVSSMLDLPAYGLKALAASEKLGKSEEVVLQLVETAKAGSILQPREAKNTPAATPGSPSDNSIHTQPEAPARLKDDNDSDYSTDDEMHPKEEEEDEEAFKEMVEAQKPKPINKKRPALGPAADSNLPAKKKGYKSQKKPKSEYPFGKDVDHIAIVGYQEMKPGDKWLPCLWCDHARKLKPTNPGYNDLRLNIRDDGLCPVDTSFDDPVLRKLPQWQKHREHVRNCFIKRRINNDDDAIRQFNIEGRYYIEKQMPPLYRNHRIKFSKAKAIISKGKYNNKLYAEEREKAKEAAMMEKCMALLKKNRDHTWYQKDS